MQGLVNFAGEIGNAIAIMIPTFCYIMAIASFLFAGWGLWLQSQPINPFQGRPWIPFASLVMSGAFASFDRVLTLANGSAGTSMQVSIGSLTSYTPPTASNVMGNSPGDAIVNVVTLFSAFFQSFGAMACLWAFIAWRGIINGQTNRTLSGCIVQFTFGVMLINIIQVTTWLTQIFQTT
ncbi:hypothetical protein CCR94_02355 [Rhodoblastus sphagnicola]|uniref:Uncharacterized protein n=1 Tax=Rhodoblastus sphagnicola TaxID=333368 RepID=A0A2S6NFA7_9HYPH|nr:hypothetical protein [Rhodoblastus sphagnicola]MBB4200225.1 hypothetical protein [Rhodoblastus sphagnicola]PPQ33264.1 hypothetical protein CCR94_02355 [Rhodoblastus sphagnicola]